MEINLTDALFEKEVLSSKLPVLVDFWAPWCGPCRMMSPILEELAKEFDGKIKIAKMNVDENQTTPGQFNVMSIPTMIFVKDGQVVEQTVGALSKVALAEKLHKLIS
ncbi:MAG: thioredoxin [bacterium]